MDLNLYLNPHAVNVMIQIALRICWYFQNWGFLPSLCVNNQQVSASGSRAIKFCLVLSQANDVAKSKV